MSERTLAINDRIYGKFVLDSPVFLDLINSKPLQRLKKIAEFGVPDEFYHLRGFNRFEHSVGVALLLRMLGASEVEQLAGLLHDVSHTAFSHVTDWVLGREFIEDCQDSRHQEFLLSSEVAVILKRYGYDPEEISDLSRFKLLDVELPELCADRVDYALREFPKSAVAECLSSLTARDGRVVFADGGTALLFARHYLKRQSMSWGGFENIARYTIFSRVLRRALDLGVVEFNDFWEDDRFILNKLEASADPAIGKALSTLHNRSLEHLSKSAEIVRGKFRYVDPLFLEEKGLKRCSEVDSDFAEEIRLAREENRQGIRIPRID